MVAAVSAASGEACLFVCLSVLWRCKDFVLVVDGAFWEVAGLGVVRTVGYPTVAGVGGDPDEDGRTEGYGIRRRRQGRNARKGGRTIHTSAHVQFAKLEDILYHAAP